MAIGLNDLKKNDNESSNKDKKILIHELDERDILDKVIERPSNDENSSEKERVLRPWESFSDEIKTRTIRAQEAVRKAKKIVARNELLAERLKDRAKGLTKIVESIIK